MKTKTPKLKMNVALLRRVKKHILDEPRRLRMWLWAMPANPHNSNKPPCGTVGCIAGWGMLLSSRKDRKKYASQINDRSGEENIEIGTELFGLTDKQAERLFITDYWPAQYSSQMREEGSEKSARVTAERIDHFIETEGEE